MMLKYIYRLNRVYSLLILIVVSACHVGPRYTRPAVVDESVSWKNKDTEIVYPKPDTSTKFNVAPEEHPASLPLTDTWWTAFDDDTLNQLIENAFVNSPSLKNAALRVMEARGLVSVTRSNYFPVITLDPSISKNQLSGNRPNQFGTTDLPQLTLTTISVPVDVSYELDVWGKFRGAVLVTEANLRSSQADYQVVRLGLASDIASNYFTLRLLDSQIQLYTNAFKLRNDNVLLTNSQYKAGLNSKLDVLQAEIEASTVESQILDAQRTRAMTENTLAVLCGIAAMDFKINPRVGLPKVPVVPSEIPSDLLQRRPDIVSAEEQLVAATAQIGVQQAAFFPSLKLTGGSFGYLSSKFNNLFEQSSQTWLAGVGISIPIFTGGRNIANKKVAEIRFQEAQMSYKQVVLNSFREVEDAMANLKYRTQQSRVQEKALTSAKGSSDMSKALYKTGLTTYLNVIVADRAVLDAENNYIITTGQRLLYSISLIKALGGGWSSVNKK